VKRSISALLLALAVSIASEAAYAGVGDQEAPAPPAAAPQALEIRPIPHPDLAGLEDAVAASLREGRALLESLVAASGSPPAELADAYGELGRLYHAHAFDQPALAAYWNAGLLAPGDYRWPYYYGRLEQAAGRHAEAAAAYGRALQLRPGFVPALVHLGEVLLAQDRPDDAGSQFRAALAAEPGSAAARAGLGQVALSRRQYREAAEHLEAALAAAPQADALHHPLALAYRGLGETERAREHLARAGAVGVKPADPLTDELQQVGTGERWHLLRGRVAFRVGRYADAATEFRAAVAARPDSAAARIDLGAALALTGDRRGAVEQLREAVRLAPGNATAHYNLGTLLAEDGAVEEAARELAAAVAADPGDALAHNALAHLLERQGDVERALRHYTEAVEHLPGDEQAALDEAGLLVRLERFRQARARLEEARARLPESGRLARALARLLAASPDAAVRDGAQALELALMVDAARPEAGSAATVALALAELGRCQEAAAWQRRALDAARREGTAERLADLEQTLATYERGAPCRPPVADRGR
jgi:tetratricopeptide (TPR) repeat protein